MSCATVVCGLEASPQWYFVPEPVGSRKYVAMHGVPFGLLGLTVWDQHTGFSAGRRGMQRSICVSCSSTSVMQPLVLWFWMF